MNEQERERALNRVRDARRHLNRAENDYINALYSARDAGATLKSIAEAAGRSPSTIGKRLG